MNLTVMATPRIQLKNECRIQVLFCGSHFAFVYIAQIGSLVEFPIYKHISALFLEYTSRKNTHNIKFQNLHRQKYVSKYSNMVEWFQ